MADSAENILRGMIDQMEELDIFYNDYLYFVRQLTSYPARPALPAAYSQNLSGSLLSGVWNEWADAVERIRDGMKRAIDHSVPLPRGEQVLCAGEHIGFILDLSNQDSPPMLAHLRELSCGMAPSPAMV